MKQNAGWILAFVVGAAVALPASPTWFRGGEVRADEDAPKSKEKKVKDKKTGKKKRGSKKGSKKKGSKESIDKKSVPPDEKAEQNALEALGEGFKVHRTKHYSIIYNTSDDDLGTFSVSVERTFASCVNYANKLEIPVTPPKSKLLTYYFNTHKDYSGFSVKMKKGPRPENNPGIYFPDDNYSMFYNMRDIGGLKKLIEQTEAQIKQLSEKLRSRDTPSAERKNIRKQISQLRANIEANSNRGGSFTESTVQHEVSHQVLWNIGFHNQAHFLANPRWLAEGTAQLFETVSTGKAANWGAVNQERLASYKQLVENGGLVPLRDFISTLSYFQSPSAGAVAYPQSWALVHYLNRTKRKELKEYVRLLNKRGDDFESTPEAELKTFEKAFGKLDNHWEKRWQRWMKRVR